MAFNIVGNQTNIIFASNVYFSKNEFDSKSMDSFKSNLVHKIALKNLKISCQNILEYDLSNHNKTKYCSDPVMLDAAHILCMLKQDHLPQNDSKLVKQDNSHKRKLEQNSEESFQFETKKHSHSYTYKRKKENDHPDLSKEEMDEFSKILSQHYTKDKTMKSITYVRCRFNDARIKNHKKNLIKPWTLGNIIRDYFVREDF